MEQAQFAAEAVEVEYEPLPVVFTMEDAMAEDAPLLHSELYPSNIPYHGKVYEGDVEAGFAQSDLIVEKTYTTQKVEHAPIETHGGVAELEADGRLVITCTTTRVFDYAAVLSRILKLSLNQLQIKAPQGLGGSFGGKNEIMLEPWIAVLCLKTKRPVKMMLTREEEFFSSTTRHEYMARYKTGVTRDGRLMAQEITLHCNTGPYFGFGKAQLTKAYINACGPYEVPNVKTDAYLVYTNGLIAGAMRGMGVPQVCFFYESQMDLISEKLGMDPEALRLKNLFGDRGRLPNGQLIYSKGARLAFDRAWEIFRGLQEEDVQ